MLEIIIKKILSSYENNNTYKIYNFRGKGHLLKNYRKASKLKNNMLLNNLSSSIRGYARTISDNKINKNFNSVLIIVCDLDNDNKHDFLNKLHNLQLNCKDKCDMYFCLAIEESEAWLLGDIQAIKKAYPNAKDNILKKYVNDSICGTWELLADAIYEGGVKAFKKNRASAGEEKNKWAMKITPFININHNKSRSFQYFCDIIKKLALISS
jgi:hypothetical protein